MNIVTNKTWLPEKWYELNKRRALIRKQSELNKEMKQNERRQKIENLRDEDIDIGRFFELATSDKMYVNELELHGIKSEFLLDYKGAFELNGSMLIGTVEHKTNIRFKNMDDFASYINAIDVDYGSKDDIFTGHAYKLNTPQFSCVKRSQHGRGTTFRQVVVE